MTTKLATKLGLSLFALGLAAAPAMAQAPATPAAPATAPAKHNPSAHAAIHAKKGTPAHDSMADQLNAQSLAASQSGQAFTPPGAAPGAQPVPASQRKMP